MTLVGVPDTDGELVAILSQLEEVLLALPPFDAGDEPAPEDLGPDALEAVQDVGVTVRAAERTPIPVLYAPDGRFQLVPLRFVELDVAKLAKLGRAVAALGRATLPAADELVAQVLAEAAGTGGPYSRRTPADLVEAFARAHGVLDLQPDGDTELLAGVLDTQQAMVMAITGGSIVLTPAQHDAYRRLTARVLAMFHVGDALAAFLYRGG